MIMAQIEYEKIVKAMADKGVPHLFFELLADLRKNEIDNSKAIDGIEFAVVTALNGYKDFENNDAHEGNYLQVIRKLVSDYKRALDEIAEMRAVMRTKTLTNLDEIKARRERINGASWKAVEGNSSDIRSSVFAGNDLLATLSPWKRHEYADFIANAPTDIGWLIDAYETAVFELLRQADCVCRMKDGSFDSSAITHQADVLHALKKLGLFEITGFGSYRYVWGHLTQEGEEMLEKAWEVLYDF